MVSKCSIKKIHNNNIHHLNMQHCSKAGKEGTIGTTIVRPDQLNKLLHGFARSNFWANRRKKIKLGGAYAQ